MPDIANTADGALAGRRVLIIVENLPSPFDRRVWQEAGAMRDAGAKVSIICPTGKGYEARFERLDGIDIHRHPLPPEGNGALGYLIEYGAALFWETVLAWRVFFSGGVDVIQACNPPDLIFLVAAPFKLLGRKFVFDHHDICPELFEAKFGRRGAFHRMLTLFERLTFALADISIATNESYRQIAIARGRMDPRDVFVVRSGPDLRRLKPVPPDPRWRNGRRFLVGYVGVMGEQEGVDLLLDAVAALVKRGRDDVQFCIVGGGPSLASLRERCAAQGLDPYVTFTGRAPDADLFEILSTADVCVNPDRVNAMNDKSTMNKILEYMAFGKPIVQFELTEGRVSAADASLYARPNDPIDMADKIEALLASPETRERMGAIGVARVAEDLSWAHQVPKLMAAYDRLFSRGRRNSALGGPAIRTQGVGTGDE
ncbi:MAG TPA: glycosyltransferase family 4 protein [Caulobacteraceae bacterium]|nr:glycosyltransferase family 4 protein [Caulobacteraceae bacterium]